MTDKPKKPGKGGARPAGGAFRKDAGGKPRGPFKPKAARMSDPGASGKPEFRKESGRPRASSSDTSGQKPFRPRKDAADRPDGEKPRPRFEREGGDERPRTPRAEAGHNRPAGPPKRFGKPGAGERGRAADAAGDVRRSFRPRKDAAETPDKGRPPRRFERDGGEDRPRTPRPDRERVPAEGSPKRFGKAGGFGERSRSSGTGGPARRPEGQSQGKGGRFEKRAGPRSSPEGAMEAGERIAKRLARAGVASRRDAEALISAGRIAVNGRVLATPAFNVLPDDDVTIDGAPIPAIERTRLFLFHKPAGLVTTNRDPEGRRTVFDALPAELPRLMTIGRLDINTEGLLLLTNDGGLARTLELPATGWLRRYRARVHGKVDEAQLAALKDGIAVDGVFYGGVEATLDREQGSNAWLTIGLREGKNREVKNILGSLGLEVSRLIRVSYGPFQLGELEEGAVQEMKGRTLRDQLGERLIEESGANFDAPVATPFSNKPVAGQSSRDAGAAQERRPARERSEPGEGGLIKNRKRQREDRREDALGRLSTRPPQRSGGGKSRREDEKPPEPKRSRSANVWMAPGARPNGNRPDHEAKQSGEGRAASDQKRPRPTRPTASETAGGKASRKPAFRKDGDKPAGRPRGDRPDGPRSDGPSRGGPRKGGGGADRRR